MRFLPPFLGAPVVDATQRVVRLDDALASAATNTTMIVPSEHVGRDKVGVLPIRTLKMVLAVRRSRWFEIGGGCEELRHKACLAHV
jgi:hypothetical protein